MKDCTPLKLLEILRTDVAKANRPLAVFDLDSTVFTVKKRTEKIVRDFAKSEAFASKEPQLAQQLQKVEFIESDWGFRSGLERLGISAPLPILKELRDHWRQHFFSNAYLKWDIAYPGVVDYVHAAWRVCGQIAYLTGRNQELMLEGTHESLKQHQLPNPDEDGVDLIMKTKSYNQDEDYKTEILGDLSERFDKIWFFENEPVIINRVQEDQPHIIQVFIDSTHSGRSKTVKANYKIKPDYKI